jgi:hypothetical protein
MSAFDGADVFAPDEPEHAEHPAIASTATIRSPPRRRAATPKERRRAAK